MKAKTLEIRDEGTFISALAIDINPSNDAQRYLMRRCGYPCDGLPNVILTCLDGRRQGHQRSLRMGRAHMARGA